MEPHATGGGEGGEGGRRLRAPPRLPTAFAPSRRLHPPPPPASRFRTAMTVASNSPISWVQFDHWIVRVASVWPCPTPVQQPSWTRRSHRSGAGTLCVFSAVDRTDVLWTGRIGAVRSVEVTESECQAVW
ncbi:hypothetical protein GUJ93_ZPchr0010g10689 [Zizania palustris]|uniref:Uncharacterized protein n=1 Tax=Zizania palustris TaxID=103762 RepID=A0A8J5TM92_ZIZPA|nr:hypothetical protein GUJ93_ZPchr0010g10689 [Zizania palustris]